MRTYELTHYRTKHDVGTVHSEHEFAKGDRFYFYCFRNKVTLDIKVLKRTDLPAGETSNLQVAIMNERHNDLIEQNICYNNNDIWETFKFSLIVLAAIVVSLGIWKAIDYIIN